MKNADALESVATIFAAKTAEALAMLAREADSPVMSMKSAAVGDDTTAVVLVVAGRGLSELVRAELMKALATPEFVAKAETICGPGCLTVHEDERPLLPPFTGDPSRN